MSSTEQTAPSNCTADCNADRTANWSDDAARRTLLDLFQAAVRRALPGPALLPWLPAPPRGRCVVVGAGKASAAMAAALDRATRDGAWADVPLSGVIVTRDGHAVPAGRIEVLEASHPVPDHRGEEAARRMLATVQGLSADDLVIALISGGGSALLVAPAGEMTLADKQAVNQALLRSGATIKEMNAVRKHLSGIKGGRLALAAAPAQVVTLVISDVPGDDPADIASGPTVADSSTWQDVQDILKRYEITLPPAARAWLDTRTETPKPPEVSSEVHLIATPLLALEAAADAARRAGLTPLILGDALEGESRELGTVMAGIARSVRQHGYPVRPPAVLLSGGETTVTLRGQQPGHGGRNTEFLLALAVALGGASGIWALAGDSDGIDGTGDAAGAMISPDTLQRGRAAGLNARELLACHESYRYFGALGDLLLTGPTLTNVNDIRAVLVTE